MSYFPTITTAQISDATDFGKELITMEEPLTGGFLTVESGIPAISDSTAAANIITNDGGSFTGTSSGVTFENGVAVSG